MFRAPEQLLAFQGRHFNTEFRENMSVRMAVSLYLLAQNALFNVTTWPRIDIENYVEL